MHGECLLPGTPTPGPGTPTPVPGDYGCGGFSAAAIWVVAEVNSPGHSTAIVPEIGVVRFDNPGSGAVPRVYTFCSNCQQPGTGRWGLHDAAAKGQVLQLLYSAPSDEWQYVLYSPSGEKKVLRSEQNTGITAGARVDIGGETTNWNHDMGVFAFQGIKVLTASNPLQLDGDSAWRAFGPSKRKPHLGEYPPGDWNGMGRYHTRFESGNGAIFPWIHIASDHHLAHTEDACGDTP